MSYLSPLKIPAHSIAIYPPPTTKVFLGSLLKNISSDVSSCEDIDLTLHDLGVL